MKKVLLLRYSSIGDIVLTSPVVRCLRQQYPNTEIHFLCKTNYASILQSNPYISKVYHFKTNYTSIITELRSERYDVIIDLHKNLRTYQLRYILGIKTYSFHKANWAKWLLVNTKINRLAHQHIVDRYMEAVAPLNVLYDGQGLDFFIPDNHFFDHRQFGLSDQETFIAFAIGAAHATKRLPVQKIMSICHLIPQKNSAIRRFGRTSQWKSYSPGSRPQSY